MSALPALPWGRAPSPPPKCARTDAGEDAAAPAAPSVWAGMPSKAPSCYGLAAGARLEVAWDFKFDGDEAAGLPPRMFTKWCLATLERAAVEGSDVEAWQLRYDADASDSEGEAEEGAPAEARAGLPSQDGTALPASPPAVAAAVPPDAAAAPSPAAEAADAAQGDDADAAEDVRAAFAAARADVEAGRPPAQHPPVDAASAETHPAPPATGAEEVRRVEFLTSCRLRDLSEAATEPASGGMLTWRRAGASLVVHLDSEPSDDDADDVADEPGSHAVLADDDDPEADAAWEEEARAAVAALPMEQRQRLAGGLRAFCEELASRVAARVGAQGEVTAEDVRECEAIMRAEWAAEGRGM